MADVARDRTRQTDGSCSDSDDRGQPHRYPVAGHLRWRWYYFCVDGHRGALSYAGRASQGVESLDHRSPGNRSEEHTSELQSLMRISYAVFCLKKKTTQRNHNTNK